MRRAIAVIKSSRGTSSGVSFFFFSFSRRSDGEGGWLCRGVSGYRIVLRNRDMPYLQYVRPIHIPLSIARQSSHVHPPSSLPMIFPSARTLYSGPSPSPFRAEYGFAVIAVLILWKLWAIPRIVRTSANNANHALLVRAWRVSNGKWQCQSLVRRDLHW